MHMTCTVKTSSHNANHQETAASQCNKSALTVLVVSLICGLKAAFLVRVFLQELKSLAKVPQNASRGVCVCVSHPPG